MNAKARIQIERRDIVPTKGRAEWLEKFGVLAQERYELDIELPITLWEDAGCELNSDGTLHPQVLPPYSGVGVPLRKEAVERAHTTGVVDLPNEVAEKVVREYIASRAEEKAEEARKEAEKEAELLALLERWLTLPDDQSFDVEDGVYTCLSYSTGKWAGTGRAVFEYCTDPRYRAEKDRRWDLCKVAREKAREERAEFESKAKAELEQWASGVDKSIAEGIRRGYDMDKAISDLLVKVLAEGIAAGLGRDVGFIHTYVEDTREWNRLGLKKRNSPSAASLAELALLEDALKLLGDLPKCVTFDDPMVYKAEEDIEPENEYDEKEVDRYTAVGVYVNVPVGPDIILLYRVG